MVETEEQWGSAMADATSNDVPLVVQFTGAFCKPCKRIAPTFDVLAREKPGVFARVDVGVMEERALEEKVTVLPAFHVYRAGALAAQLVGDLEGDLIAMVQRHCP